MNRIMGMVMAAVLLVGLCTGASAEDAWVCPTCGETWYDNFCENDGTARTSSGNAAVTSYEVGDIVRFGSYEQDNDASNGAEPIEWQVLEVKDDGSYVLMSVYGLEAKPYNEDHTDVTWKTCTLRAWLNGDFYRTAFTDEEQARIVTVTNRNAYNPSYGTRGGNNTEDRVWLLSLDDVCRYYEGISPRKNKMDAGRNEQLIAKSTEYAKKNSAWTNDNGAGWWWLRSPGSSSNYAAYVHSNGYVYSYGLNVNFGNDAMARPVVVVALGLFN